MKKQIIVFAVLVAAFTVVFTSFSIYQSKKIERELGLSGAGKHRQKIRETNIPVQSAFAPAPISKPEDYGMIELNEFNTPRTQGDWDSLVSKKISEVKTEVSPENWEKIKAQYQEDPQKTADKMKQVDENIEKCREALQKDPGNDELKARIERLMKLHSIGEALSKEE